MLLTWQREELGYKSRLTHATDDASIVNGVELEAMERAGDLVHPTGFSCANCDGFMVDSHERMYVLSEMDDALAEQLRGLLYDENVLDPGIREKVWKGSPICRACEIEAEIGTEEVPHPVDPRVHTCQKKVA